MKIFMLFALASVSVCNAVISRTSTFRCDEYEHDFANDDKCVKHALENGPGLMKAGQQILCKYKNYKEKKTDKCYKELKEEIETFWDHETDEYDKELKKEIEILLEKKTDEYSKEFKEEMETFLDHETDEYYKELKKEIEILLEEKTGEYDKELEEELETFRRCTGCDGLPRGLRHPLGEVDAGAANTTAEVLESVESLGHSVGLHEAVLDLACTLLNPAFASNCVKNLIGEDVWKVTDNVKKMLCQKETNLDAELTIQTLKDAGCFGNDVLGTDKVLANLTEDDGKALTPALWDLLGVMKEDPVIGQLVSGVSSPVEELVTGVLDGGRTSGGSTSGGGTSGGLLGLLGGGRR